ncbi:PH domain-like protein [Delitschia confertaspora ATCC 74209]|uniref:PH domain-like protein n=1 Tax=Delitschia confertaspora ATCC 74209 TaxID=1513339 RepID=A0A9P4MZS5_9PLEO|nr:PH domain-like protein [Delitschia confertaspora ATCC 74209]
MASLKRKARLSQSRLPQPYDYETDANFDLPAPPPRSNEELNLSVIRRHYPAVTSVLSIAPYVVLYLFSPEAAKWLKNDVEGGLFVCQLTPSSIGADRFAVAMLNRRGLDNFFLELSSAVEVDSTEEYVILQDNGVDGTPKAYGLWIFSEEGKSTENCRAIHAQIIQDCAKQAEQSRKALEEQMRNDAEAAEQIEPMDMQDSVSMGRQVSLRELFGQQRESDADWSVHDHHSAAATPDANGPGGLLQLFQQAKQNYHGAG